MIFVTVGSSEPFDRLVHAVDEWAEQRGRTDVFAQIGRSNYQPKHIECSQFLGPSEFRERFDAAEFVVAHAGMGSIITALEIGKTMVVMPRRAHLGETRSDHQVATADRFGQQGHVLVAMDEHALSNKLDEAQTVLTTNQVGPTASPLLISTIRNFIENPAALDLETRKQGAIASFIRKIGKNPPLK
ncbi:MAG TPA: glycosyltransferase [Verrucomicrobiae bacterium]|nr:glycosyltransferase [Verrucomicrobiae bacterium]